MAFPLVGKPVVLRVCVARALVVVPVLKNWKKVLAVATLKNVLASVVPPAVVPAAKLLAVAAAVGAPVVDERAKTSTAVLFVDALMNRNRRLPVVAAVGVTSSSTTAARISVLVPKTMIA